MSQIIKKKFRRSLPWLLILCLISSSVSVFAFNFDVKIEQTLGSLKLSLERPEANADTATTSVSVKNAPPSFVGQPYEGPVSSSTSPINNGSNLSFSAQANDAEGNDFYLLVCISNTASAPNGGGTPSCGGGIGNRLCVSGAVASNGIASCDYTVSNAAESQAWYAFVCDNHPGPNQADCSSYSQGSGDSGSPFYINHAPTLVSVATTGDNKDPGAAITITATTTDPDSTAPLDDVILDICLSSNWATSTGCVSSMPCQGTSTMTGAGVQTAISCNYTLPIPKAHGSNTYYAYIKDWHGMAAASGNGTSNTYNVNDVAPTVSNVILNGGANITLNIKGAAAKQVNVSSDSVVDNNGCNDLVSGTSTIYISDVANGYDCTDNDNGCYQEPTGSCAITACVGGSTTATITCTSSLAFYATPSDVAGNNPHSGASWKGRITAIDQANKGSGIDGGTIDLIAAPAIEINELYIDYGQVRAGTSTAWFNATTTVINYGNTPLNSGISGTDMTKLPDTITRDNQKYDLSPVYYDLLTNTLQAASTELDTAIARPQNVTNVTDDVYWGINIPAGKPSGSYEGTNTFAAIMDTAVAAGEWN